HGRPQARGVLGGLRRGRHAAARPGGGPAGRDRPDGRRVRRRARGPGVSGCVRADRGGTVVPVATWPGAGGGGRAALRRGTGAADRALPAPPGRAGTRTAEAGAGMSAVSAENAVTLRPMTGQDIDRCLVLERELFAEEGPWSAQAFRTELSSDTHYLVAVDSSGEIVGYAGLAVLGRQGDAGGVETEVRTIAVAPRARRRGIGTALLTALLSKADELDAPVFLEVRVDN